MNFWWFQPWIPNDKIVRGKAGYPIINHKLDIWQVKGSTSFWKLFHYLQDYWGNLPAFRAVIYDHVKYIYIYMYIYIYKIINRQKWLHDTTQNHQNPDRNQSKNWSKLVEKKHPTHKVQVKVGPYQVIEGPYIIKVKRPSFTRSLTWRVYIYIYTNFEPDGGHWAGAGMAFRIYEAR